MRGADALRAVPVVSRRSRPFALAAAMMVAFIMLLFAQAFGLRALSAFLRHGHAPPTSAVIDRLDDH